MIYNIQIRRFFLYATCLLFVFNISCKKNIDSKNNDKDSITILYFGDERIFHQDYWGTEATYWIFLPLVAYEGNERGEIQPVLAESWTHSEDYKTWAVKLRDDIFWHDGVQMTSKDVKFTIELRNEIYGNGMNTRCELIDDFTFKFIVNKPISTLPTWEVYYPKHLLEKLNPSEYYNWDFWLQPVGNGPYKFVRNIPKTMVEVEVNPNYFGKEPKIRKAILKFSKKASLQELLSGNVDAITLVPRDFLFKIKGDDRFKSYYWWGSMTKTIFWNHRNSLFSEAKVRKALTMAINRLELSEVLNYPKNITITDVLHTNTQRENNDFTEPLPYNPDKAIELLKESGWIDTNADNILDKDGTDFNFTITIGPYNSLMTTYIQDNLKRIGVKMDIETVEESAVWGRLKNKNFEAAITTLNNNRAHFHQLKGYFSYNAQIGYLNRKFDSIFNLLEDTGDKDEIDKLYKILMSEFERDIPVTFLLPNVQTHIVKSKIKGLHNLSKVGPVWFLKDLWIE